MILNAGDFLFRVKKWKYNRRFLKGHKKFIAIDTRSTNFLRRRNRIMI